MDGGFAGEDLIFRTPSGPTSSKVYRDWLSHLPGWRAKQARQPIRLESLKSQLSERRYGETSCAQMILHDRLPSPFEGGYVKNLRVFLTPEKGMSSTRKSQNVVRIHAILLMSYGAQAVSNSDQFQGEKSPLDSNRRCRESLAVNMAATVSKATGAGLEPTHQD